MYNVTVYLDSNGTHLHQLFSGLFRLARAGLIKLKFANGRGLAQIRPNRQFIEMEIGASHKGRPLRCIFDLQDSQELGLASQLAHCDLYFKRSFNAGQLTAISPLLAAKIRPYGFNYQVLDSDFSYTLNRVWHEFVSSPFNPLKKKNRFHVHNLLDLLRDSFSPERSGCTLFPSSFFEQHPDTACIPGILFQCRLWEPHGSTTAKRDDMHAVNASRATLVAQLRAEFGTNFVGGLQPTRYAIDNYPHLVATTPTRRDKYIELVKSNLITICTTGLLNSTGWKFGEYVAASKCIVSEPLSNQVPGTFCDPHNYLTFTTVDECLAACSTLLSDPQRAQQMRHANWQYYEQHVRADVLLLNLLQQIDEV